MADLFSEFVKRGLNYQQAAMLTEAVYSCAIEGGKIPQNSKEIDDLVELIKENV